MPGPWGGRPNRAASPAAATLALRSGLAALVGAGTASRREWRCGPSRTLGSAVPSSPDWAPRSPPSAPPGRATFPPARPGTAPFLLPRLRLTRQGAAAPGPAGAQASSVRGDGAIRARDPGTERQSRPPPPEKFAAREGRRAGGTRGPRGARAADPGAGRELGEGAGVPEAAARGRDGAGARASG